MHGSRATAAPRLRGVLPLLLLILARLPTGRAVARQGPQPEVKLARSAITITARAPGPDLPLLEDPEITISPSQIIDLSGAKITGADAAGCALGVASLGLPAGGCGGCRLEAREGGGWALVLPPRLPERIEGGATELQLQYAVEARCGGGGGGAQVGGSLTVSLLPDTWEGPWCPPSWPEGLRGVGVAVSVAFTPTRAADCAAAPFSGAAANAAAALAGLVNGVLAEGGGAAKGLGAKAQPTRAGICKGADETNVGYGITQAVADVVPPPGASMDDLRAALARTLHLANLCPGQPAGAAYGRFCAAAAGGAPGGAPHFATACVQGAPEGRAYVRGRPAGAVDAAAP
ncbi:MAG: hypothetical protein J3K34DRAFT_461791 [Monoraphidium minutum]|nr:MAG: hypothetical protein J3K34DRAFT_461791 [Monoraphidium minutum]